MLAPKRLAATLAVTAILGGVAPVATSAADPPAFPQLPGIGGAGAVTPTLPQMPGIGGDNANLCLKGVVDIGPFGPNGPYGSAGPYGPNGPMHGQQNPIGDAAQCGGLMTYILRGGTLQGFVQGSIPHS